MRMKQGFLATTTAVALVAGVNLGLAQSSGSGGGMGGGASQGAQPSQSQGTQRGQGMERQGETRGQAQGQQQRQRDPMTGQSPREGQREMQREGQRDGQRDMQRQGQEPRQGGDRDRTKAGQERDGARERGAEQRKDGARDRETTQERRGGSAGETTGSAPARVTSEQRSKIVQHREVLNRHRVDRSKLNVDIRVGATVPRTVTFYELPPQIIEIVPAWRSYRYVVVDDEIVIIDPNSYRIVAVIDA